MAAYVIWLLVTITPANDGTGKALEEVLRWNRPTILGR
jgi:hypothetical protein